MILGGRFKFDHSLPESLWQLMKDVMSWIWHVETKDQPGLDLLDPVEYAEVQERSYHRLIRANKDRTEHVFCEWDDRDDGDDRDSKVKFYTKCPVKRSFDVLNQVSGLRDADRLPLELGEREMYYWKRLFRDADVYNPHPDPVYRTGKDEPTFKQQCPVEDDAIGTWESTWNEFIQNTHRYRDWKEENSALIKRVKDELKQCGPTHKHEQDQLKKLIESVEEAQNQLGSQEQTQSK
jgi:hypothetical protein